MKRIVLLSPVLLVGCGQKENMDLGKPNEEALLPQPNQPKVTNIVKPTESGPSPSATKPESLSPEVMEAWKKAGFRAGWMGQDKTFGYFTFSQFLEKLEASTALPAFVVIEWKPGVLEALPEPQSSFGLSLGLSGITDTDLKEVARFQQLTSLDLLSCKKVTDAGLKDVAKLQQLTTLHLWRTKITDAGLKEVAKLQNLTLLALDGNNNITIKGLKELVSLKQLTMLTINDTKITNAGLAELRNALPKCIVVKVY
jgi:hypothetical protein